MFLSRANLMVELNCFEMSPADGGPQYGAFRQTNSCLSMQRFLSGVYLLLMYGFKRYTGSTTVFDAGRVVTINPFQRLSFIVFQIIRLMECHVDESPACPRTMLFYVFMFFQRENNSA